MGALLFDERPIVVDRKLAKAIGLKEAIVVQQIHYWIMQNQKAGRNFRDGRYWTYNSYPKWTEEFGLWCERTVKSIFSSLEKSGVLMSGNYNKASMDQTKWYTINYDVLSKMCADSPSGKLCPMDSANFARQIPEINPEKYNTIIGDFEKSPERAHSPSKTAQLLSLYGEDRLFAMTDLIDWYIDVAYPKLTRNTHPIENRYKRFSFASDLLECVDTLSLDDGDIIDTIQFAVTTMLTRGCGYVLDKNGNKQLVDPFVYYITNDGVIGYWLITHRVLSIDQLRDTRYHSIKEAFYD